MEGSETTCRAASHDDCLGVSEYPLSCVELSQSLSCDVMPSEIQISSFVVDWCSSVALVPTAITVLKEHSGPVEVSRIDATIPGQDPPICKVEEIGVVFGAA